MPLTTSRDDAGYYKQGGRSHSDRRIDKSEDSACHLKRNLELQLLLPASPASAQGPGGKERHERERADFR